MGQHPSGVTGEFCEQLVLPRRQVYLCRGSGDFAPREINEHIAEHDAGRRSGRRRATAQDGRRRAGNSPTAYVLVT